MADPNEIRNENGLTEEEQRLQDELDGFVSTRGPPTDQQNYNTIMYPLPGQPQNPNQFPNNTQGGFLGQSYGTGPAPPLPRRYGGGGPSMTNGRLQEGQIQQQPTNGFAPITGPPMAGPNSTSFPGMGTRLGPPYGLNPLAGIPPGVNGGYNILPNNRNTNPFQPGPVQYLPDPNQPPPLIGFPQRQDREYLANSRTGPLDPNQFDDFPASERHEQLLYDDSDELQRQMLFYVDYSAQRAGESTYDYNMRSNRSHIHMGIERRRRPLIPANMPRQFRRRAEEDLRLREEEHRERLDPNDEAYNPGYANWWRADRAARQARNAQRRAAGVARLRAEFAHAGHPGFPDPPDPEDSGDELFTHDQNGPLPPRDGGDSQGNSPPPNGARNPLPRGRGNNGQTNGGQNRPPNSGGRGGQGEEEEEEEEEEGQPKYSTKGCLPCRARKIGCSMRDTGLPCTQCKEKKREKQCVRRSVKPQGVKPGTRRGPYKKKSAAQKQQEAANKKKGRKKTKKVVDEEEEEEEEEEEDEEESESEDEPELHDDDSEEDEEQPPPPPPPAPSRNPRKRKEREPTLDDDDEQEEPEPEPKKPNTRRVIERNSETRQRNPTPPPNDNQSSGRRIKKKVKRGPRPDPDPDPCLNCERKSCICGRSRPCNQCIENDELDCDGNIIDQTYRPEVPRHMRSPVRQPDPPQTYDPLPPSGYSEDTEMPDVDAPPLQALLNHQNTTVPNATAEEVLGDAGGEWRGGREPGDADPLLPTSPSGVEILEEPRFFEDAIAAGSQRSGNSSPRTNTSDNAVDPALPSGPSQNPTLPAYAKTAAAQPPPAAQQTQNANTGANSFIKIMRLPNNNPLDWDKACDEPMYKPDGPKCDQVPTRPCDHLPHAWWRVCEQCEEATRQGEDDWDEEEFALLSTQQHLCRYCAEETKRQYIQEGPNSAIQATQCLCIGQVKMAWLCGVHRDEAIKRIQGRADLYERNRVVSGLFGKCPACNARNSDRSTGVWRCGACGETVIAPGAPGAP